MGFFPSHPSCTGDLGRLSVYFSPQDHSWISDILWDIVVLTGIGCPLFARHFHDWSMRWCYLAFSCTFPEICHSVSFLYLFWFRCVRVCTCTHTHTHTTLTLIPGLVLDSTYENKTNSNHTKHQQVSPDSEIPAHFLWKHMIFRVSISWEYQKSCKNPHLGIILFWFV